jgi:hypothetical protein
MKKLWANILKFERPKYMKYETKNAHLFKRIHLANIDGII